jgi:Tfp pilus assembly protein PilF
MIKFVVIIVSLAILGFIFLKHYLLVEKNISLKELFFKPKNWAKHMPYEHQHEFGAEEMIPSPDQVDDKNRVKADSMVRKSDIYLGKGDINEAEKNLIQALALDPSSIEAYKRLGLLYLRQGQFTKAENIYKKLVFTIHDEPTYFSNLGMALYSQKKLEEAKKYYKKAIELDSDRIQRIFSLGQIHYELQEMEEAMKYLKKATEMEPDNLDYMLTLVHFYVDYELVLEARTLAEELARAYPEHEEVQNVLNKLMNPTVQE